MIALSPIKFTFTSHLIVTLGLSLLVFVYATCSRSAAMALAWSGR